MVPGGDPAQRHRRPGTERGVSSMVTRERPTLEAVARRAGVSRATVSRVVNGSTSVAASIREAVNRAVEELGYVPNQAARSLVTQRTESIALILPETANRVFSDDLFFPAIIRGRQRRAGGRRQAAGADDGRVGGEPRPGRAVRDRRPRRRRHVRLDARRRPAARHARAGSASRWSAAAARSARRPVPYVDVDHFGGVCRGGPAPGRHRPPPDRHHRRPAGHGRRHRPAGRLPGHPGGGRPRPSTWRSATSPASRASRRCASCSPTTRTWTRSSWPPT